MALIGPVMVEEGTSNPEDARQTTAAALRGAVLGLDFGLRRIGVAVGDLSLKIAHPLETIDSTEADVRFARISALVAEWRPVRLVVGMPTSGDGSEHDLAPAVHAFCGELESRFSIPAQCVDERYTSAEAQSRLRDIGVRGRAQKQYLDQVAATTILDDFFAHHDDKNT